MTTARKLPLHEQLLLLSLHDEKGTTHESMFAYAIAGAIIAELLDTGRLTIDRHKQRGVLVVANPAATGDPLLDECLQKIAASQPAVISTWVARFAAIKDLKDRIAERLCQLGILTRSEDRFLWVLPRTVYPTADPDPEHHIVSELRDAITADGEIDGRTAMVVALSHSAGILPHVFDRHLLKARSHRIDAMVQLADVSGATQDAIDGARAAVAILVAASPAMPPTG